MTTLHLDKTNFNTEKIKNKFKRITNIKNILHVIVQEVISYNIKI